MLEVRTDLCLSSSTNFVHGSRVLHRKQPTADRGRPAPSGKKQCNCKNSRCLKLYCECFASGRYCESCNCVNCHNNRENEATRQSAVDAILERNPNAFRPKISAQDVDGGMARHGQLGPGGPHPTNAAGWGLPGGGMGGMHPMGVDGPSVAPRHTKGCNCKKRAPASNVLQNQPANTNPHASAANHHSAGQQKMPTNAMMAAAVAAMGAQNVKRPRPSILPHAVEPLAVSQGAPSPGLGGHTQQQQQQLQAMSLLLATAQRTSLYQGVNFMVKTATVEELCRSMFTQADEAASLQRQSRAREGKGAPAASGADGAQAIKTPPAGSGTLDAAAAGSAEQQPAAGVKVDHDGRSCGTAAAAGKNPTTSVNGSTTEAAAAAAGATGMALDLQDQPVAAGGVNGAPSTISDAPAPQPGPASVGVKVEVSRLAEMGSGVPSTSASDGDGGSCEGAELGSSDKGLSIGEAQERAVLLELQSFLKKVTDAAIFRKKQTQAAMVSAAGGSAPPTGAASGPPGQRPPQQGGTGTAASGPWPQVHGGLHQLSTSAPADTLPPLPTTAPNMASIARVAASLQPSALSLGPFRPAAMSASTAPSGSQPAAAPPSGSAPPPAANANFQSSFTALLSQLVGKAAAASKVSPQPAPGMAGSTAAPTPNTAAQAPSAASVPPSTTQAGPEGRAPEVGRDNGSGAKLNTAAGTNEPEGSAAAVVGGQQQEAQHAVDVQPSVALVAAVTATPTVPQPTGPQQ
eukprot:gene4604-14797_t